MTSQQTIKAALSRLARFEARRVYSHSYGSMINGRRIAAKRAGAYKVGK